MPAGAGARSDPARRHTWHAPGFSGAPPRISSTPKPSGRWNRCWRRARISSARTIECRRSARTSAGSRSRGSRTSTPCALIPRPEPATWRTSTSTAAISRARKNAPRRGSANGPDSIYAVGTRVFTALLRTDFEAAESRLASGLAKLPGEATLIGFEALLHARRRDAAAAIECASRALASPRCFGHTHHVHYTLACVYAELGDTDKAMAWLERSADTGFPLLALFPDRSVSGKPARRTGVHAPGRRPRADLHRDRHPQAVAPSP